MKLLLALGALLLVASPVIVKDALASERLKGYNYGYVYGVGNILCGLAIDKLINKEYAKEMFSGGVKALSENPDRKPCVSEIRNAYQDIIEDVVCKEVYQ